MKQIFPLVAPEYGRDWSKAKIMKRLMKMTTPVSGNVFTGYIPDEVKGR